MGLLNKGLKVNCNEKCKSRIVFVVKSLVMILVLGLIYVVFDRFFSFEDKHKESLFANKDTYILYIVFGLATIFAIRDDSNVNFKESIFSAHGYKVILAMLFGLILMFSQLNVIISSTIIENTNNKDIGTKDFNRFITTNRYIKENRKRIKELEDRLKELEDKQKAPLKK